MLSEPVNSEKSDPPYCTLYTVQCTMYIVHCTICTINCTLYTFVIYIYSEKLRK